LLPVNLYNRYQSTIGNEKLSFFDWPQLRNCCILCRHQRSKEETAAMCTLAPVRAAPAISILIGVCLGMSVFCESGALGQPSGRGGGRRGGGQGRDQDQSGLDPHFKPPPAPVVLTPHGGHFISSASNYYEVVYLPLQTRIYVYDKEAKPLSARKLYVRMALQVPGSEDTIRVPFRYVAPPPGGEELSLADKARLSLHLAPPPQGGDRQDYVAASFDLRQMPEKDTPIGFEFSGLPDRRHPTACFTPMFSRSRIRPYVAQVLATEADRAGLLRQRVCPVSGEGLGAAGPVVKVLIGDFPLYLSNQGCIEAVRQSPERFLSAPGK
jgi:hypothetical protein